MSAATEPTAVAEFLRDIHEATARHQVTVEEQTRQGFVVWCADASRIDGVSSPWVERPADPSSILLRVDRPGKEPGPEPVQPKAPQASPDGTIAAHEQQRYEAELREFEKRRATYLAEREQWLELRDLYQKLFTMGRTPPDGLELVAAIGLLKRQGPTGSCKRHVAAAPLLVDLDPTSGRLTVALADTFKAEINWVDGELRPNLVGSDDWVGLLTESETLRDAETVCSMLVNSFGANGVELDNHDEALKTGVVALGPHVAVLLRKKDSSALLDLLTDMAADLKAGGFVSDPFRMIVDPGFEAPEKPVQSEDTALPLPASTDQRAMINRARSAAHTVIQGPPGTGKTHTIANLASVLMAEGRRVLITAENERALHEVQAKLPESMQPLLVPMLREGGSGPLASSVNALTEHASSARSSKEQKRRINDLVGVLNGHRKRIRELSKELAQVSEADRQERRFRGTSMALPGHLQALAQESERVVLVDRYLSVDGTADPSHARTVLDLVDVIDEAHERLSRFTLPVDLDKPSEFSRRLEEYRTGLRRLGEPGSRDYSELGSNTKSLEQLSDRLLQWPHASWTEITRSQQDYEEHAATSAELGHDLDLGITVEPEVGAEQALEVITRYLDLDGERFDRPFAELIEIHTKATDEASRPSNGVTVISSDPDRAPEVREAIDASRKGLDLLAKDESGLLSRYVGDIRRSGRSGVEALIEEAQELLPDSRAPLGVPVNIGPDAPPARELLRQVAGLVEHLRGGGRMSGKLRDPKPVREAAGVLEHVDLNGAKIKDQGDVEYVADYLRHLEKLVMIEVWAERHGIAKPIGVTPESWLQSIVKLGDPAQELHTCLEIVERAAKFVPGAEPKEPAEVFGAVLAVTSANVVKALAPFVQAHSDMTSEVRVDGHLIANRSEAERARKALNASTKREELRQLIPEAWRPRCHPLRNDPDDLTAALQLCAMAASVPGRLRSPDLSSSAIDRIRTRAESDRDRANLNSEHRERIGRLQQILAGCVPQSPATAALKKAVDDEDAYAYSVAYSDLEVERSKNERTAKFQGAVRALSDAHPKLMDAFGAASPEARDVLENLAGFQELRDYRCAIRAWQAEVGSTAKIHGELAALHLEAQRLEAQIAEQRCWARATARIKKRRELRSALSNLSMAMSKIPKTRTAKSYAPRMRALREATRDAAPAIPCWVMPIGRIPEVLGYPVGEDRFDAVIVDEASQAWFTASFLYAIADQVIVVGDDLQISPADQVVNEADIRAVADEHIVGHRLANQVSTDLSLYDVAQAMTGPDVMLDHFRCVPEIIELSNRLSYEPNGKTLRPARVRQPGSLEPVIDVRVDGEQHGAGVNQAEIDALVAQVVACHSDRAYAAMDFGVVVVGAKPHAHIRELRATLLDTLGPIAMAERDIEVGTPAEFQGAERNVMFLSLLNSPGSSGRLQAWPHEHTGRNRRRVQRLNVAVSRAKDQLWIYRSFGPEQIAADDVRQALLSSVEPADVDLEAQLERCDSQFERDVVIALAEADPSLRITTQVSAIGYSIDLVVEDEHGHRIAVECDGDRWHTSDTQIRSDLHRQRTLEGIGWTFVRFLASEWYADPDAQIVQIQEHLSQAKPGDEKRPSPTVHRSASIPVNGDRELVEEKRSSRVESPAAESAGVTVEAEQNSTDGKSAADADAQYWRDADGNYWVAVDDPAEADGEFWVDDAGNLWSDDAEEVVAHPSGDGRFPNDYPDLTQPKRHIEFALADRLHKAGLSARGRTWSVAKAALEDGASFGEAIAAAGGVHIPHGHERLTCATCARAWIREVTRGRKPRNCPECAS